MDNLLHWNHTGVDIPARGLDKNRAADAAQRAALARELDLVTLDRLEVSYRLRSLAKGRFALAGRIIADVTQTCVVSLEPMTQRIDEPFAVELWPAEQIEAPLEDDVDPDVVEAEPIDAGGGLPVGRIVAETLATAIDPHPRKPDAAFAWQDEKGAAVKVSPFAALAKLKPK